MTFTQFLGVTAEMKLSFPARRGLWEMCLTFDDEKRLARFAKLLIEAEKRGYGPDVPDPDEAGIEFATTFFRMAALLHSIEFRDFKFPKIEKPKQKIPKLEKSRRMNGKASKNRGPKKGHP